MGLQSWGKNVKIGDEKREVGFFWVPHTALYPPRLPPPETVFTIFRDQSRSKYGKSRMASE